MPFGLLTHLTYLPFFLHKAPTDKGLRIIRNPFYFALIKVSDLQGPHSKYPDIPQCRARQRERALS